MPVVVLYVVIPFVALLVWGVAYDLSRRVRGVPAQGLEPGVRAARADAESRRFSGGH